MRSYGGVVMVFCLVAAALGSGCLGDASPGGQGEEGRMLVAVTIPPQAEFVERVGGERVSVLVLVPPGASPHTYEPTPAQITALSDARMYAAVGSGIEAERAWLDRISGVNPDMLMVNCSEGIALIDGDPHVWLSVRNAQEMAERICDGLIAIDPDGEAYYRANLEDYLTDLDDLDRRIAADLAGREGEAVMVYHPSWGYFMRDYGLTQVPIEADGKEPTPAAIERLIRQAEEEGITVVFASPESSTRSAEVIADAIGGRVVTVSPLARDYTANMETVADAFAEAAR
ncbi:zinc ABC transporter substrate-binding protein [Methanofollis fontis]|uniref:Zinc ABC transporter substrate-binding protein n=2 Tax=Methanofollis fontis TaxID=2052832 RepID=A0A483CRU0_9EURY|nr:zinc ABC transporter substrate-binding protein [Methanofollis fontis]